MYMYMNALGSVLCTSSTRDLRRELINSLIPNVKSTLRKKSNLAVLYFLVDSSFLKIKFCWFWTSWLCTFVVNPHKIILQNIFPFESFQIYDWIMHEPIYFDWLMHYPFTLNAQSLTWKWQILTVWGHNDVKLMQHLSLCSLRSFCKLGRKK